MDNSEKFIDCLYHKNCGGFASANTDLCEDCLEAQAEIEAEEEKQRLAIADLKNALAFFDKVQGGLADDAVAVGTDHFNWLEKAARKVVELN